MKQPEGVGGGWLCCPARRDEALRLVDDGNSLQIHGKGPFEIKYVNPADDPRNAKK
jgi:hypothetical protein